MPATSGRRGDRASPTAVRPPPYANDDVPRGVKVVRPPSPDYATTMAQSALVPAGSIIPAAGTAPTGGAPLYHYGALHYAPYSPPPMTSMMAMAPGAWSPQTSPPLPHAQQQHRTADISASPPDPFHFIRGAGGADASDWPQDRSSRSHRTRGSRGKRRAAAGSVAGLSETNAMPEHTEVAFELLPPPMAAHSPTPPDNALPFISSGHSGGAFTGFVDTESVHSGMSSMRSSLREDLPLCPEDADCPNINDKTHQRQFAHTCRLHPCYHGALKYHARLFRHLPGQCVGTGAPSAGSHGGSTPCTPSLAEGGGAEVVATHVSTRQRRRIRKALKSVNFSSISPNAPNATTIAVACPATKGDVEFDIAGDWASVRLHSFKRYLHQVLSVPPVQQRLLLEGERLLDDELATLAELGVGEGARLVVDVAEEEEEERAGSGARLVSSPLPAAPDHGSAPAEASAPAPAPAPTARVTGQQQRAAPSGGGAAAAAVRRTRIDVDEL